MFIFIDVRPFRQQLDYNQTMTCSRCGHFGRYEVYITGNRFRLFFIPIITFGKKYIVRTSCCDTLYLLDERTGKAIQRGETIEINEQNLQLYREGGVVERSCRHCGAAYTQGAHFCPNCGTKLD